MIDVIVYWVVFGIVSMVHMVPITLGLSYVVEFGINHITDGEVDGKKYGNMMYMNSSNPDSAKLLNVEINWVLLLIMMIFGIISGFIAILCITDDANRTPDSLLEYTQLLTEYFSPFMYWVVIIGLVAVTISVIGRYMYKLIRMVNSLKDDIKTLKEK